MNEVYTVVLDDPLTVATICGTNDKNLELFEAYFRVPIVARGNELILMSSDESRIAEFESLIRTIVNSQEFRSGTPDEFIASTVKTLTDTSGEQKTIEGIHIPRTSKTVYPKNAKQAEFVSAIKKSDLTFGIGPAGREKLILRRRWLCSFCLSTKLKK